MEIARELQQQRPEHGDVGGEDHDSATQQRNQLGAAHPVASNVQRPGSDVGFRGAWDVERGTSGDGWQPLRTPLLVGGDLGLVLQRQADIVQAVEQTMAPERIDVKAPH